MCSPLVVHLSPVAALEHLPAVVSFHSVDHLSAVAALQDLSTSMCSPLVVHLSPVAALQDLSTVISPFSDFQLSLLAAVLFPPVVFHLSFVVALEHFPTAVSTPLIVLKETKIVEHHSQFFSDTIKKERESRKSSSLSGLNCHTEKG